MQVNILPLYTPTITERGQKVETVFLKYKVTRKKSEENYASKMFALMHIPGYLGWVKRPDIELVQISIF